MSSATRFIDLGNPLPRRHELPCEEFRYATSSDFIALPRPARHATKNFFSVVEHRRTRREFGHLDVMRLSSFLWWSAHTRHADRLPSGFIWEHRPTLSAGGRHPADILVFRPAKSGWRLYLYEAMTHRLVALTINELLLRAFVANVARIVNPMRGTIIWLAAQPIRTFSKYRWGDSLVWRDAGVLIGHMALVAEALDLNFCPLGTTGEPHLFRLLGAKGKVFGVGGGLLGARSGHVAD